jgi:hypothetical protein
MISRELQFLAPAHMVSMTLLATPVSSMWALIMTTAPLRWPPSAAGGVRRVDIFTRSDIGLNHRRRR